MTIDLSPVCFSNGRKRGLELREKGEAYEYRFMECVYCRFSNYALADEDSGDDGG